MELALILLILLAFTLLVVICVFVIIPFLSKRSAGQELNKILAQTESTAKELPYPLYKYASQKLKHTNMRTQRITIVAPFGICKKMTVRSRTIPIGLTLAELGYKVKIIIPPWDCPQNGKTIDDYGSLNIVTLPIEGWLIPAYNPLLFVRLMWNVISSKPDIVYCFKPIGYSGAVSLLCFAIKSTHKFKNWISFKKVFVDTDDWEGWEGWGNRVNATWLSRYIRDFQERMALQYCDVVTVASQELEKRVLSLRRGKPQTLYLPNSLLSESRASNSEYSPPDDLLKQLKERSVSGVLLLFTRFAEYKTSRLISIFEKVLEEEPNTVLLVIGASFDNESRMQRLNLLSLVDKHGIDRNRIIMYGWLAHSELYKHWAVTNIALYPVEENCINQTKSAVKVLELMAAGKAIVADKVGELENFIIHEKTGYLVEHQNDELFASYLVNLLRDKDLQVAMGNAARQRILDNFTWNKNIYRIDQAIQSSTNGTYPTRFINEQNDAHGKNMVPR